MNKTAWFIIFNLFLLHNLVLGQKPDLDLLQLKALISEKKYAEATYPSILVNKQNNSEKLKETGICYYHLGNFKSAITCFIKADSINPNYTSLEIAKAYASLKETLKATQWLEKYLSGKNKLSELEISSDKAFDNIKYTDEWNKLWKKEWYTPSDIEKSAIMALIKRNNYTEALSRLDNSRNTIIPKSDLFYLEALIYKGLKQYNNSISSLNQALETSKRDIFYYTKAEIFTSEEKYADAFQNIDIALQINPNELDYYFKRADLAIKINNIAQADRDISLITKILPNSSKTIYLLAKQANAKGNYQNAFEYYTNLLDIEKYNVDYRMERGEIAYKTEQYSIAEEDMAIVLDMNPNLEKANLIKGKIRLYFADKETACFYLEKASRNGNSEALKLMQENCSK